MNSWEKILVSPSDTLMEVIEILHEGGYRIALVTDHESKLIGTVTDGDVRRALINNVSMNDLIKLVMNKNPLTVSDEAQKEEVLAMMEDQDLLHMPIVDQYGVLCDLVTLQQLHKKPVHDNPVFIMAGGFGKRLHPLTKDTPKPLLKVGDKPILDTIIEQFVSHGFRIFYISTHFMPEKIKDNFVNKNLGDISIEFIHESEPLGTAGSLGLLPKNISKLPIIIMNGDLLTKVNFSHLLEYHEKNKVQATMCVREYDFQVPYGVVKIKGNKINGIEEKPVHNFFVNAGVYVLNHELIKKIDGRTYIDMTDFLESELDSGGVSAFPIHEYWLDIGQVDEYNKANRDIYTEF
jgi:UDP-2,4-diacetamido-2,4,6-trideoxy-beta-L-gulopyranose hydrolase